MPGVDSRFAQAASFLARIRTLSPRELIVVNVLDGGLRSVLIARLTLQGETLVTLVAGPGHPQFARSVPSPAFLIIDAETVGDAGAILSADSPWTGVIVLADAAVETSDRRVRVVNRTDAPRQVQRALVLLRESAA